MTDEEEMEDFYNGTDEKYEKKDKDYTLNWGRWKTLKGKKRKSASKSSAVSQWRNY